MLALLRYVILVIGLGIVSTSWSGKFKGELTLLPPGCKSSLAGICKLGSELTYESSRNKLVWKTNIWTSDKAQSGTTDGASIPRWAQPIIGEPYNWKYLKAAVVHDHYCYEENQVRSWRDTHLMFYDAMIDLGVEYFRAKVMYFAVYFAGPKWVELVKGEICGNNCIQTLQKQSVVSSLGNFHELSLLNSSEHQKEILKLYEEFKDGNDFSIMELEERAKLLDRNNFFFKHGDTYSPTGSDDPNLFHQL